MPARTAVDAHGVESVTPAERAATRIVQGARRAAAHPSVVPANEDNFAVTQEKPRPRDPGGGTSRGHGDLEAEQLVRDNIGWMLALAERVLRDRALAEDAVQEAFMAAFRGLQSFEGRSSLNMTPKRWQRCSA